MKKLICLSLIVTLFISCKSTSPIITEGKSTTKNNSAITSRILETATGNLGTKYKYAGTTRAGFDCSGLVYSTFKSEEILLPRSSYEQSKIGKLISQKKAQKGDLIFFKTNNSSKINHVGIITKVENEDIQFIHSSTSKGVIISSILDKYYKNSFVQINRIL